jgi:D-methionine transport system ATP-binding protein
MIELVGLNKSFGNTNALCDINLFIQEGEIFGIIGKSGAGKSTLLRSINLLERPDSGEVIIDNENIVGLHGKNLRLARHKMAMIFQHFNLLSARNVYDNIALPMRIQGFTEPEISARIDELLPLVGLDNKRDAYPSQLSGGQKQRVAIARALTCSPKILLSDESTSSLDPETTDAILQLLKKINQIYGITIVLITHEMDVVKRICHRLAVMTSGTINECASLATILNTEKSLARAMLYSQLSPEIPHCLLDYISIVPNDKPLLRIYFQGEAATMPFISKASRELGIDINILLANIDRFDTVTCGVMVVELKASSFLLADFVSRCEQAHLTVEILGYVTDPIL